MIVINQGQANIVAVTLTEKSTLTNPYYLFEFQSDDTKIKYYCIAADNSTYKSRYNRFSITEKTSPTPTAGEIRLSQTGFYHYTIYEQSSATNLDPALATGVVETGKMKVPHTAAAVTVYDSQPKTNTVYNA